MTRVALGGRVTEVELQLVAVRADQAHPAFQVRRPALGQRGEQRVADRLRVRALAVGFSVTGFEAGRDRRAIPDRGRERLVRPGDPRVRLHYIRSEIRDEIQARGEKLPAVRREMTVPDIESRDVALRPGTPRGARGLEQRVALL